MPANNPDLSALSGAEFSNLKKFLLSNRKTAIKPIHRVEPNDKNSAISYSTKSSRWHQYCARLSSEGASRRSGGEFMIEVRFHGRGGQGAKIASRILGHSAFLSGLYAQDFALFGAERRGAPVVSCTRIGAEPIGQRGYIEQPSLVVVLDAALIKEAAAQVFHGVESSTPLFINAGRDQFAPDERELPPANYHFIDLNRLARELIGRAFVSAAAAGVAAKCITGIKLDALGEAVRNEIAEFGLAPDLIAKNEAAARKAYQDTPVVELPTLKTNAEPLEASLETVPYLGTAQFGAPTIRHRGNAALRATGNWRMERPELDLEKCKRCFLCYLYCPDAAIRLDGDNFPHVDYEHCKGCMICYEECPTDAISRRVEE
jgi:pyruvate ferredoxin oxidoreductase gamma subunit